MVIDIDDEVADQIVCENINNSYKMLSDPKYQKGMFSMDEYENLVRINLLRRAMETVYEYYSNKTLE
jgi:hypothetical protein